MKFLFAFLLGLRPPWEYATSAKPAKAMRKTPLEKYIVNLGVSEDAQLKNERVVRPELGSLSVEESSIDGMRMIPGRPEKVRMGVNLYTTVRSWGRLYALGSQPVLASMSMSFTGFLRHMRMAHYVGCSRVRLLQ